MLLIPVKENIKQDTANPNRNPKANSLFGGVSKAQMQVAYLLMIRHQSTICLHFSNPNSFIKYIAHTF